MSRHVSQRYLERIIGVMRGIAEARDLHLELETAEVAISLALERSGSHRAATRPLIGLALGGVLRNQPRRDLVDSDPVSARALATPRGDTRQTSQ